MRQASEDTVVTVLKALGQEGAMAVPIARGTWVWGVTTSRLVQTYPQIICDLIGARMYPQDLSRRIPIKPRI